jgi:hypothetical protein
MAKMMKATAAPLVLRALLHLPSSHIPVRFRKIHFFEPHSKILRTLLKAWSAWRLLLGGYRNQ